MKYYLIGIDGKTIYFMVFMVKQYILKFRSAIELAAWPMVKDDDFDVGDSFC